VVPVMSEGKKAKCACNGPLTVIWYTSSKYISKYLHYFTHIGESIVKINATLFCLRHYFHLCNQYLVHLEFDNFDKRSFGVDCNGFFCTFAFKCFHSD
jgi:hypothetical protein